MVPLEVTNNASSRDAIIYRSWRVAAAPVLCVARSDWDYTHAKALRGKGRLNFLLCAFATLRETCFSFCTREINVKSRYCWAAKRGQVDAIQRTHGAVVCARRKLSVRHYRTQRRRRFS